MVLLYQLIRSLRKVAFRGSGASNKHLLDDVSLAQFNKRRCQMKDEKSFCRNCYKRRKALMSGMAILSV